jgi:hypothetical protein
VNQSNRSKLTESASIILNTHTTHLNPASPASLAPQLQMKSDRMHTLLPSIIARLRVVTIIDLLPIKIINGSCGLHTAEVPAARSLYSGFSFRSRLSLGVGTGNAPLICAYHGITGNSPSLGRFRSRLTWFWQHWLSRRGRGSRMT